MQCTAYTAPFDVRMFPKEDGSDNVVLQPDVFVVCDKDKVFIKTISFSPNTHFSSHHATMF